MTLSSLTLTAIGLMSGTSADGVDGVLVRTDGLTPPQLLAHVEEPYPDDLRREVMALYRPGDDEIDRLGRLHRRIGARFAEVALAVCREAGVDPDRVDVVGSHGQTVRHAPPRFTLQIGCGATIQYRTGITTVTDFRPADMVRGGEGAPLVPLFHRCLFGQGETVVVNLGGIANITAIPARGGGVVAGDTGPANSLIDLLASRLGGEGVRRDENGIGAAAGRVDDAALAWLLAHPYLARPFPKSTGREMFGAAFLGSFLERFPHLCNQNGLATLTRFTTESVARACRQLFPSGPRRLVVCGGGACNAVLMAWLAHALPTTEVVTSADLGVEVTSLEAQAFAWFAVRTLHGLTSSLPEATGADEAAVLGNIHPGRHWIALLRRLAYGMNDIDLP